MTHLLDTHAWIQRALGETLPPLVDQTLTRHAETLALADISLWEAAKLVELGRLELSIPLAEFFRLAIARELTVLPRRVIDEATVIGSVLSLGVADAAIFQLPLFRDLVAWAAA